ncbi:caspase domain-containing protein [Desarmillaria tabescens]|uniref:Caspase domain-containing protein n=1 Tax=Armillaria tabescens TaxID=1929756 RepID=A0AA39NH93_ARMTA|nr:caspase domain-containing protein [Desarmillaria tabescens]KAK0465610.1 caspase domain-containing protein [Desarmillaria tabescens]
MDNEGPAELQPTHDNILCHITRLVHEPQDGEHFFFHYSGHGTQEENLDGSEEDGMDECLIAMDGETIKDDVLRRYLVDRLPPTCYMTAVLDTCHSASLLADLEHFRCNRDFRGPYLHLRQRTSYSRALWDVLRCKTMDTFSRRTIHQLTDKKGFTSRRTSFQSLINASFNDSPKVLAESLSIDSTQANVASCLDATKQCESPIQLFSLGSPVRACCNGFCPLPTKKREVANVVCISSCKDQQQTWEVTGGMSLTQALIKKCSEESHPLLASLMLHVKYEIFKNFCKVFEEVQKYSERLRSWQEKRIKRGLPIPRRNDEFFSDMNFRQDPQLSSPEPLVSISS